jgi:predicted amidohydrolase
MAVFNSRGELTGKYRKSHLYTCAPVHEERCFGAGNSLAVVEIGGFKCGLMICYDLRFPEMSRALALKGAEVLLISSAWLTPRVAHWDMLLRARAIENQVYVAGCNRTGTDGGTGFCGSSAIVDPYGITVAAAATDREELLVGEITRETIQWVRGRMPVFNDRRADLY